MTFSDISYKMFKANMIQYKLFILCNVSSIAVLYSFISILKNEQFMDSAIVDPMISSNILAPTVFLIIFICIFIPYTQNTFIKARQKDYGILLTLGMTENEVRNSVLIENMTLCLIFLLGGLLAGTVLSVFFLYFIRWVLGIGGIDITISLSAYITTTICVSAIFVITLAINIIGVIKSSIYEKLKYTDKTESRGRCSIILLITGIVITLISLVCMTIYYRANHDIFIVCWIVCIAGSALVFFNGEAAIKFIQNKYYKKYIRNILVLSDVKYYYSKNKKIFLVNAWLFFIILFFVTFSLVLYLSMNDNAMTYHPFHMAYAETDQFFQPVSNDEIELIVKNNGNSITLDESADFVRNGTFTIFCADDINRLLGKNYEVESNAFIFVYGYDRNDGYDHDYNFDISSLEVHSTNDKNTFDIQDTIIDPLFGSVNAISNYLLLANKDDYEWIVSNSSDYYIHGTLHLYNLENWRNSDTIVNELWDRLLEKNNIDKHDYENNRFYRISSRIEANDTALKSCNLLIFTFIYISLLLYFSAIVMIHFKLKMEQENEKKKFHNLYRIGIQEPEIKKIVHQKILVVFFIPLVYAAFINLIFIQCIYSQYGYSMIGAFFTVIITASFLLIHLIVYRWYAKKYNKDVNKTDGVL